MSLIIYFYSILTLSKNDAWLIDTRILKMYPVFICTNSFYFVIRITHANREVLFILIIIKTKLRLSISHETVLVTNKRRLLTSPSTIQIGSDED